MPSYSSPRSTRASTEAGWFETDLFGRCPRLLVSLLEKGEITLKDLKALQSAAPVSTSSSGYASMPGLAACALTSIRGGSATTKYWIWVATSLNFVLPVGAVADKLWASLLSWAAPLGIIGGFANTISRGWIAAVLLAAWLLVAYPDSADAHYNLADAYLKNGQKDLARQYAEKALAMLDSHTAPLSSWSDTEKRRAD
jgi:tetratricopeptide (TPR) repeat protein